MIFNLEHRSRRETRFPGGVAFKRTRLPSSVIRVVLARVHAVSEHLAPITGCHTLVQRHLRHLLHGRTLALFDNIPLNHSPSN